MEPDFSFQFHQSSKNHSKGHAPISSDHNEWPKEWSTVCYKAYDRSPKIPLTSSTSKRADLFELIHSRSSRKDYSKQEMSLEELSLLLKYSCGTTKIAPDHGSMRRAQPSGGARFPIEVYALVFRANGIKPGLYHYNVKLNALDVLWEKRFTGEEIDELFTYNWVKGAGVVFILTAVFRRNQNKYGERGYRYILLEAGHIGQNTYLTSEALGIKCCGMGGTRDEKLEKLLDIDGVSESIVYALSLGR